MAFLLARGARPDGANAAGRRVVHAAANSGDVATLEAVLAAGADLNVVDAKGQGPLHVVVDFPGWHRFDRVDRSHVVAALLARGASPDQPDSEGVTARELGRRNLAFNLGPLERAGIARALDLPFEPPPAALES